MTSSRINGLLCLSSGFWTFLDFSNDCFIPVQDPLRVSYEASLKISCQVQKGLDFAAEQELPESQAHLGREYPHSIPPG